MEKDVSLVFPNQLFQINPALSKHRKVYLVEEWLFFNQFNFHKHKLVLHRASMRFYKNWLEKQGFLVEYIDAFTKESDCRILIKKIATNGIKGIHFVDVVDNWLFKRIQSSCSKYQLEFQQYESPNFLNKQSDFKNYFSKKKNYFQTDFYINQRKKENILLDSNSKPFGGKWTFDQDNRKKFPKSEKTPELLFPHSNAYINEAKIYVDKYFKNNYGSTKSNLLFSVTFEDAEKWAVDFFNNRFEKFGIYEDAIVASESVLYHSVISPMLNIGLLDARNLIDLAIQIGIEKNIPLNSIEGFIRQILGWREFVRIIYELEGGKQRITNFWEFKRKIPKSFWTGETGIEPIDITIKKVLKSGYCHHIERLMIIGNFMFLCEFDPDEVYRWFMELFIDSYDWVMVPNVYGMSQYADGGLMTTKPYFSGSNYLIKMSDFPKGEWQKIWDGLFWRFMHKNRSFFSKNPRMGMLLKTFDKMPQEKQFSHLKTAQEFLDGL